MSFIDRQLQEKSYQKIMCAISLSFPDSSYSEANKPSVETLKNDLNSVEVEVNTHTTDATIHFLASTLYPVGCIYMTTVETNPATIFGFGTWTAWGTGRVPVGVDTGQTEFDTAEETGGAKTHTLTGAESGQKALTLTHTAHSHTATIHKENDQVTGNYVASTDQETGTSTVGVTISSETVAAHSVAAADASSAHNNLQPYITCYMFKRTA